MQPLVSSRGLLLPSGLSESHPLHQALRSDLLLLGHVTRQHSGVGTVVPASYMGTLEPVVMESLARDWQELELSGAQVSGWQCGLGQGGLGRQASAKAPSLYGCCLVARGPYPCSAHGILLKPDKIRPCPSARTRHRLEPHTRDPGLRYPVSHASERSPVSSQGAPRIASTLTRNTGMTPTRLGSTQGVLGTTFLTGSVLSNKAVLGIPALLLCSTLKVEGDKKRGKCCGHA